MNYSTNYNLNKPERSEQFNLDHWNNNTDVIDTQMHINKVNIAQNATDIATLFTGLNTKNTSDTNSVFYKLMKLIYPVGSLYWSANSTNPGTLFGGSWVQIKDRFVLACGDTYKTAGATGGASSVTLSVSNMPSHNHSFTPSGTVSSHSHGLNKHTHSFSGSGTTGNESAHESFSWLGSHGHSFLGLPSKKYDTVEKAFAPDYYNPGENYNLVPSVGRFSSTYNNVSYYEKTTLINMKKAIIQDSTISIKGTCTGDHNHSFSYSGTTGGASGNTENATPTFKGTAGTTGSNGSGTAFSILPPYVVK